MTSSNNDTSDLTEEKLKDQIRSMSASQRCPSCDHELSCNPDMDGFPAGVRFDPSDQELIEHLESMVNEGGSRAHPLIGVTRDGFSKHFFHRPSKAYPSGTRKRRKIQSECGGDVGEARWHKTGNTRPVIVGGRQKGCKKILVLHTNYGKKGKPEKANWVMHQYHLGTEEEGELVVSKVFYHQTHLRSATATMMEHKDEKVDVTSKAMKDMLPGCGAAIAEVADAMIQLQQHQQQRQADGQSRFTSAKTAHEVGAGDPLAGYQGQLHETHHIPSPHEDRSVLQKPVHTMSVVKSTPLNTESIKVSLAVQSPSALLNNGEKKEDQQRQKKVDCRRPCSSKEAMIACQTNTEEDVQEASTQPKGEIQRPYYHWL